MNDRVPGARRALLEHYDRTARDLPWRGETDPYRVLVSEVMLQQTRVATVERYYGPWLERFPDVHALAEAREAEVLKAWEGLGYYRRARNLHAAARAVRERGAGEIPRRSAALRDLPGVGAYTAGAVASIAFGEVTPAVDGNVRRVLSRLLDRARPTEGWLRDVAASLVDPERPGDWNQALMDLGATLCTPRSPRCGACPLEPWCDARAAGTVARRPERKQRAAPREADFAVGVFHRGGRVLLVRRPSGGLLGGMWSFPEKEVGGMSREGSARDGAARSDEGGGGASDDVMSSVVERLAGELGLALVGEPVPLDPCAHRFTHLAARYHPWSVRVGAAAGQPERGSRGEAAVWVGPEDADALALPVAQRRMLEGWSAARSANAESAGVEGGQVEGLPVEVSS